MTDRFNEFFESQKERLLSMRRVGFLVTILVVFVSCLSNEKSVEHQSPAVLPSEQTTYWVIIMYNPIGTRFISEVCPLPISDNESVVLAARAWSNGKFTTSEQRVYKFEKQDEAERFRRENGGAELKLNANDLKKYLCPAFSSTVTGYWVFIVHNYEGERFMSEVCPLPEYERESLKQAVVNMGRKDDMLLEIENDALYLFQTQKEAEKFHQAQKIPAFRLTAESIKKYICVEQIRKQEASKEINSRPAL